MCLQRDKKRQKEVLLKLIKMTQKLDNLFKNLILEVNNHYCLKLKLFYLYS